MPLFIKATSMALLHFPVLNSSVDAECENLTFKVSCVVKMLLRSLKKKFWRTLRDGTFSNHRTETNSLADKYFGHFQSSELNICLYIFFRVPTILVLPWILSKDYQCRILKMSRTNQYLILLLNLTDFISWDSAESYPQMICQEGLSLYQTLEQ